jgi:uncharacterized membrane protein YjjP (DUF1212 family)
MVLAAPPVPTLKPIPTPERAEALLVRVAELLHAYGTPAHRLERLLGRMSSALGLEAAFLSTPTSLLAAFGSGCAQRTRLLRVEPGQEDLGKLVEFDELLEDVEHGRLSVEAALQRAETLAAAPPRHGLGAMTLAFGVASAGAAPLLGGGQREALVAFLLAAPLAGFARLLARREEATRLFVPLASALVAIGAVLFARAVLPVKEEVVTLAALIVLVPGLSLTVATLELTSRHLVSGTARMAGALTSFLVVALGVALGRTLAGSLLPAVDWTPVAPPSWSIALAVGLAPIAFAVFFQARWREVGWLWATSIAGFWAAQAGAHLSPEAGPFLGALVVGLIANLYARALDRPASVLLTPGILLLVPGSVGYRAVDLFLARDAVAGTETVFQVAFVAIALAGGLLLAGVLLPPRRTL